MNVKWSDKVSNNTLGKDQTALSRKRNQKEKMEADWSYTAKNPTSITRHMEHGTPRERGKENGPEETGGEMGKQNGSRWATLGMK